MSLKWPSGREESGGEATFNNQRANKWTDSIIPSDQMTVHHLSGSGSQRTAEELSSSILYMLTSFDDLHVVSGNDSVLATTGNFYWPAYLPYYFIPMSGAQYIAAISCTSGGIMHATIAPAECPD